MARDLSSDRPSLDPEIVATQTFSSAFRGFDTAEVRGYLEVIARLLRDASDREEVLARQLADAEERLANPPPLDEHQLAVLLGEETTRVIETARQAALDIRLRSEEAAASLVREAEEEAAGTRASAEEYASAVRTGAEQENISQRAEADDYATRVQGDADAEVAAMRAAAEADVGRLRIEAESILAVRTEEADTAVSAIQAEVDRLRTETDVEVEALRSSAADEIAEQRAAAVAEADAEIEAARQDGRAMVAEARAVRERMLTDLADRRRAARGQLDQLRATREWMLETLATAKGRIDEVAGDLAGPQAAGRPLADDSSGRDAADDAVLAAMMVEQSAPTVDQRSGAGAPRDAVREVPGATGEPATESETSRPVSPVIALETVAEVETVESIEGQTEPAADSARPGAGEPEEGGGIDALFAKIRAAQVDEVQPADGVVATGKAIDETVADVVVDVTDAKTPSPPPRRAPVPGITRESINVVGQLSDDGSPDPMLSLLERRDGATDQIERQLARRLKRILSDEQNELLDQCRRTKGVPTADVILPDVGAHADRYAVAAADDLAGAATAGASFYGAPASDVSTKVDDIAARLADELVRQLRARLTRCFSDSGGDEVELGDRIRACYREWKTQRIADTSRHFVLAAFTRGLFDAAPAATAFRWIVDDGGTLCPDAEDNALQGEVVKGDPFPTGDSYPPAHPGCRCMIVPVEVAVLGRADLTS